MNPPITNLEYHDLHLHSIYSDGTFSPAQLVAEGLRKKLRAVALTDHNTVDTSPLPSEEQTAPAGIVTSQNDCGFLLQFAHLIYIMISSKVRKAVSGD